jgi:putative phosphoribosyl transferase
MHAAAQDVRVGPTGAAGMLTLPDTPEGLVIFAHGSGSSRFSPRNREVAARLAAAGLATLLFDLLDDREAADRRNVFDIGLLGGRVADAVRWARGQPITAPLGIGLFGASTGAAAALVAAAGLPADVAAVVSRGGRPDLAAEVLDQVRCPILLIVGGADLEVLALNRAARAQLRCPSDLVVVPGATHLFEEPGAMEHVTQAATDWFLRHLGAARPA